MSSVRPSRNPGQSYGGGREEGHAPYEAIVNGSSRNGSSRRECSRDFPAMQAEAYVYRTRNHRRRTVLLQANPGPVRREREVGAAAVDEAECRESPCVPVDDQRHRDVGRDPLSSDRAADDEADGARRRRSVGESEGEIGEVERQVEKGEERGWAGSCHVPCSPPPTVLRCRVRFFQKFRRCPRTGACLLGACLQAAGDRDLCSPDNQDIAQEKSTSCWAIGLAVGPET